MYSFAGVYLGAAEGTDVAGFILDRIRPEEVFPLASRTWPNTLTGSPVLDQTFEPNRPIQLNTLYWPWGASRFARAHFVCDEPTLTTIRQHAYSGGAPVPNLLVMDDGGTKIQTEMWLLPPRPLSTAADGAGLWLLTFVDERYWWWGTALQIAAADAAGGWLALYAKIGGALGTTITPDPITGAYGIPPAAYASLYRPLPAVLDAIAFSVGQRIVRKLDGTVVAQNYSTASSSVTAQLAGAGPKYAGGKFALTAPADQAALVPASLTVVFPGDAPHTTTVTLASLATAYAPATIGAPWDKLLHRYDAGTSAALDIIATQAATDWYNWQLAPLDQQFAGINNWTPEGLHDIEWRQDRGRITTRVFRGPYNPLEDLVPVPTTPPDFLLLRVNGKTALPVSNTRPSGQQTFYSWTQVDDQGNGTVLQSASGRTGGSSVNDWPLYEESGNSMVPIDGTAIVHAWKGEGNWYLFVWPEDSVLGLIVGQKSSTGSIIVPPGIPDSFLTPSYYWVELTPGAAGGPSGLSRIAKGRGTDARASNLAWEQNSQTDVQVGSVVRLWRGYSPGADTIQSVGSQEWLFAKPSRTPTWPPCTDLYTDVQTKDQCDYPILNRYTRTLIYQCGVLQTPVVAWQLVGQVGCCDCDVIVSGSGSVSCCCPPNPLCIYWPTALYEPLRSGVTLQPNFTLQGCVWTATVAVVVSITQTVMATITATWLGCEAPQNQPGTLAVTVSCTLNGVNIGTWGNFEGSFPRNANGCWDMTVTEVVTWDFQAQGCDSLGPTSVLGFIGLGPCTHSGSGSCTVPAALCVYVPVATGDCACAVGSQATLTYQGNHTYSGTLTLSCPNNPMMFVDVMYFNDGTTWTLKMDVSGCNGDTGWQEFSGKSNGNCFAGLPQCVTIPGPNNCCGAGLPTTSGTGPLFFCVKCTSGPLNGQTVCVEGFSGWTVGAGVTWDCGYGPGNACTGTIQSGPYADDSTCAGACDGGAPPILPLATTTTPPGSSSFQVCVNVGPCQVSGSTTDRYWCIAVTTAGGGVSSACCPDNTISETVTATVSNAGAANGSYTLTYIGGGAWQFSGMLGVCPTSTSAIVLNCLGGGLWSLSGNFFDIVSQSSASCSPLLNVVFSPVNLSSCGGGSGSAATVTITGTTTSSSGSGSGSTTAYECLPESVLSGVLAIGGHVTWAGGAGTISSGPYSTPYCDNQCPPISGTTIPEPCCSIATPPPFSVSVTFGGSLASLGSMTLKPVVGANQPSWSNGGPQTLGSCGPVQVHLICNANDVLNSTINFCLEVSTTDATGTQSACIGQVCADATKCSPLTLFFSGKLNQYSFGGPTAICLCVGDFTASAIQIQ